VGFVIITNKIKENCGANSRDVTDGDDITDNKPGHTPINPRTGEDIT
jgi:hypothetical protein